MLHPPISASVFLGDILVGHLSHYQDGRNVFALDENYLQMGEQRPTLSVSFQHPKSIYTAMHSLPSFFSNLLPEGYLREYMVNKLGIKTNNEFAMLMALNEDLPGNILIKRDETYIHTDPYRSYSEKNLQRQKDVTSESLHFSLAGVQIKFSMLAEDHQFTFRDHMLGNYIVKTPSVIHARLPENEFSIMKLAESVGIDVPEVQLVPMKNLENLPELNLPDEQYAYAIKRFDREGQDRIHIEDFAQVFGVRSYEKYSATNYDSMSRLLKAISANPLEDIAEFVRRITFNILIANTDAHLKNFSLIYSDKVVPKLAPAYDLVTSLGYINNTELALNFARHKQFYEINDEVIRRFSKRIDMPNEFVLKTIESLVEKAADQWPNVIKDLPIPKKQYELLKIHWKNLQRPFQLKI